jgi:hypothetical protein
MKIKGLAIAFLVIFLSVSSAFAQDATDSAQVDKESIKEKLKERLEKTISENPIVRPGKWRALFGQVESKTENTLTLSRNDDKKVTVNFNEETEFSLYVKGRASKQVSPDEIDSSWFAIAMGTEMLDNQVLQAKRISFSIAPAPMPERKTIIGKVLEIDSSSITISNGKETEITIPSKYSLQIKGVEKPDLEDVNIDDKAVVIVEELIDGEEITFNLKSIYVAPSISNPNAEDNQVTEATAAAEATDSGEIEE